jgi:hypothetical protein
MKRSILGVLILSSIVMLAACNSQEAPPPVPTTDSGAAVDVTVPTATTDPGTSNTSSDVAVQPTRDFGTEVGPVPVAGTLIAAATEDPDAGIPFTQVYFQRTGGDQPAIELTINGDGTATLNGQAITVAPDLITQINNAVSAADFFGLQGNFVQPGVGDTVFNYAIFVDRNGSSRLLNLQEGSIPPPLQRIIDAIQFVTRTA